MNKRHCFIIRLDDYEKVSFIDRGGFGEVFLLKNKKTNELFAGKISIDVITENSKEAINLTREINIMSKMVHPSICKFIGYSPINFVKEQKPVIITEYCSNKSLADINNLSMRGLAPEEWDDTHKLITIYGIAAGMSFLHSHDIIHRDLKPANILMDSYLHPKISDFGISKDEKNDAKSTTGFKGTILYASPEIIEDCMYTKAGDVYAFAIIVYEIFTNEVPFGTGKLSEYKILNKVASGKRPEFNSPIEDSYRELIENCWKQDKDDRPTFDEILEALENDLGFITDMVDEKEFYQYVDFIHNQKTSYNPGPPIILKPQIDTSDTDEAPEGFPKRVYNKLKNSKKKQVRKAVIENHAPSQYSIAIDFLKGYPKNIKLGLKYLKKSVDNNYMKAAIYYCRCLIYGDYNLQVDLDQAKEVLEYYLESTDNASVFLYYGIILTKKNDHDQALEYLLKASAKKSGKASYLVGKNYYEKNDYDNAEKYFKLAKKQGYMKSPPEMISKDEEEEEDADDDGFTINGKKIFK